MSSHLPKFRAAILGAALAVVSLGATAFAQDNPAARSIRDKANQAILLDPGLAYNPYTLLVRYRPGVSEQEMSAVRAQVGGMWLSKVPSVPGLEVISTQIEPAMAAESLNRLPWVEYVEVDHTVRADVIPNDPSFGSLWGLHNTGQSGGVVDADIDAPEAWDIFTGNPNTVVAVIDTGIQRTHPDLAANSWTNPNEIAGNGVDDDNNGRIDDLYGWDFVNSDNDPSDDHGHGTHCAGTIGAVGNNGVGVTGVNWNVKMVGLKFLSASGSGSTSNAVLAVDYCRRTGIKISSNSWGGGGYSQALYDAINLAGQSGHIFVAAAGNSNVDTDTTAHYPSSYNLDNLISVASIDRLDAKSSFSNYGAVSVDLGAPGSSIFSTYPGSAYATMSGTSMACPHVSGAVALLWGFRPTWTRQQIRSTLFSSVRPTAAMNGRTVTGGVLNVHAALVAAGGANTAPTVGITSPAGGATFVQGTSVTFTGTATDTQDGNLSANLSWSSSLDGNIGSGASFSTSGLSAGSHTVTASVTDSGGMPGSATVSITITPANTPPTVSITSPANGGSATEGTSVTFTGSATDTQDGNLSANLSWTSSLDGNIGSGASFSTSTLAPGLHTITASVTDAGGLNGSASISFTVNVPGPTVPNAPSNLTATRLRPGVRLDWVDNSSDESGFRIERQVKNFGVWTSQGTVTVGANVTTLTQNPGAGQFRFRVQAYNGAGPSAWTAWVNIKL